MRTIILHVDNRPCGQKSSGHLFKICPGLIFSIPNLYLGPLQSVTSTIYISHWHSYLSFSSTQLSDCPHGCPLEVATCMSNGLSL